MARYKNPQLQALYDNMLALAGDKAERPRTKQQLIDFLAVRRQDLGGSVSEHNHRRLLATRTKAELLAQYERIAENERSS